MFFKCFIILLVFQKNFSHSTTKLIRRVVLFKGLKEFLHCLSFSSWHFHLLSPTALYSTPHFLDQQLRTRTRCIFLPPFFLRSKIELNALLSLSQFFHLLYSPLKFRVNTTLLSVSLVVYSLHHIMLNIIHSKVTYCWRTKNVYILIG